MNFPAALTGFRLGLAGRLTALALGATIGVTALGVAPAQAAPQDIVSITDQQKDVYRAELLTKINEYRASKGLAPFKYSSTLSGIAQDESDRAVSDEDLAHSMNFASDPRSGGLTGAGEISAASPTLSTTALVEQWKNSPIHNELMLSTKRDVAGIGVTQVDGELTNTKKKWQLVATVEMFSYATAEARPGDTVNAVELGGTSSATPEPEATTPVVPEETPAPEVMLVPEATEPVTPEENPIPEVTEPVVPEVTPAPEVTPVPEATEPVNPPNLEPQPLPTPEAPVVVPTPKPSVETPAPLTAPFKDVAANRVFAKEIAWTKDKGVLNGWSDGTFRPNEKIGRYAMAAVAYRMAGSPDYTPPAKSHFKDVKPGQAFYKEINWTKDAGIFNGWNDGTFRPGEPIGRYATAAMLYRMSGEPAYTAPSVSAFKDITPKSAFYKEINWMADQGISNGWTVKGGEKEFRSFNSTTRDQMAAFLYRFAQR